MASREIDPWPRKYWLSGQSFKTCGQKTFWQQYYLSTLQKPLIPYTEGRWSKFYSHTVYQKKTIPAIMILYRNTKVKVRSRDGHTHFFDIVAGALQRETLAPYLFIICLAYVLRTLSDKIKENGFELTEKKQKVPRKNKYRRRLRRWHSDSGKCTRQSRNPTA